jgi:hypothetical protein
MASAQRGTVIESVVRLLQGGTWSGLADRHLLERLNAGRDEAAFERVLARF